MMDFLDLDDDIDDALKKRGYDGFFENNSKTGQNIEFSKNKSIRSQTVASSARLGPNLAFLRSEDHLRAR